MAQLVLQLIGTGLVVLLVALLTGFAPTRILLPSRLRPYELLVMPAVGIGVVVVLCSLANTYVMPLRHFTWVLLTVAASVNAWVLLKGGGRTWTLQHRETIIAVLIALTSFVLGLVPLGHYGYVTTIGLSWDDAEYYFPLADLVAHHRINEIIPVDSNPVIANLNRPDTRGGAGWGLSYLHAIVNTIMGLPPHATFAVLLAAVTALLVPSAWALFRTVGLRQNEAAFAVTLLALHPLIRWIEYFGYGGHVVALALLPSAIALVLAALDARSWRPALLASIPVSGLLLSYYTAALPLLAATIAPLILRRAIIHRSLRPFVGRGLVMLSATLALALVGHLRFLEAVSVYQSSGPTGGWGNVMGERQFVPLAVGYGAVPFQWYRSAATGPVVPEVGFLEILSMALGRNDLSDYLAAAATTVVSAVAAFAIWRRRSTDIAAIGLGSVSLLLYLWKLNPYPYGYFKALSLLAFVAAMLIIAGLSDATNILQAVSRRAGLLITPMRVGLLVLVGTNGILLVNQFMARGPGLFDRPIVEVAELRKLIPAGSSVHVSNASELQGPRMGFISYLLLERRVCGNLRTAFGRYSRDEGCQQPDFAVLPAGVETPTEYFGYMVLWQNERVRLVQRPQGLVRTYARGKDFSPASLNTISVPLIGVSTPSSSPSHVPLISHGRYDVLMRFVSASAAKATATIGEVSQIVEIQPGASDVLLRSVELPSQLTIHVDAAAPIILQAVEVWEPGIANPTAELTDAFLYVRWQSQHDGPAVRTSISGFTQLAGDITWPTMDIEFEGTKTDTSLRRTYQWWSVGGEAGGSSPTRSLEFDLNLTEEQGTVSAERIVPISRAIQVPEGDDIAYQAVLWLWQEGHVWRRLPLFTFAMSGGEIVRFLPKDGSSFIPISAVGAPRSVLPSESQRTMPPSARSANIHLSGVPTETAPNAVLRASVEVTNESSIDWIDQHGGPAMSLIRMIAVWTPVVQSGTNRWESKGDGEALLPRPLLAGQSLRLDLAITSPSVPGIYDLHVALLQQDRDDYVVWLPKTVLPSRVTVLR